MSGSPRDADYSCPTIPIDRVRCSEGHIRKTPFSVDTLKVTIADAGLLQPILVYPSGDGSYDVIDGARRLAALRELGVRELILGRDVVVDVEEREADFRFKQLIANLQREDLNAIELGQTFVTLKEEYGYQYNEIAEIIGKSTHYVAAKVGLIKRLDPVVRQLYLDDINSRKCIQNTFFSGENASPEGAAAFKDTYGESGAGESISCRSRLMNVNVLEDIARLPREVQEIAYREIRAGRLDKDAAFEYLRALKNGQGGAALLARDRPAAMADIARAERAYSVRRQIDKIARDLQDLVDCVRDNDIIDREIISEIESMIRRLSSLRSKVKAIEEAGTCKTLAIKSVGL